MNIPHNKPTIDSHDTQAVLQTLKSGFIAQGANVALFENLLSKHTGISRSAVVSNGTTAIYLSLLALGVKKNDEVILPTYVCSALLNSINLIGAKPVLVDVDLTDFNIQWNMVDNFLNNKTKAIIVPHIHGIPSIIPSYYKGNISIIEDCCTAINSSIHGIHIGHQADCAVFSFYATKYITSGGYGGCISSFDNNLIDRIFDYREFDCRDVYYPRFNFQISDIQAAMGVSQINRVNDFTRRRNEIASVYKQFFDEIGIDYQKPICDGVISNNYRFIIKLERNYRDDFIHYLRLKGVSCIVPIENKELLHNYLHIDRNRFPNAEKIAATTISLPIYPLLSEEELYYIMQTMKSYFC